jgi:hypothetical protein
LNFENQNLEDENDDDHQKARFQKNKKIMKSIRKGVEFLRIQEKNEDHHKRGQVLKYKRRR